MKKPAFAIAIGTLALSLAACDVEQTEEAELPDVEVEGGNLPEFDVDVADVEVGSEEVEVEVPTVDVEMPDAGAPGEN